MAGRAELVNVLTVNAGSTTTKLHLVAGGVTRSEFGSMENAIAAPGLNPDIVAHRLVHGGAHSETVVLDDDVRAELEQLVPLDPLHEPPALHLIDATRSAWPGIPHVACFDTAFHQTMPSAARHYALPEPWRSRLVAYGFHGLSHAWAAERAKALAPRARRIVVAHLGGGSSLCGVLDGRSQVTTMGFSAMDGLVMATRPGHLDPGAAMWLMRQGDLDVEALLSRESGLIGLTGTSDMRRVLDGAHGGDPVARFALEMWEHRFQVELGGCVAALGGLDALIFTGGIGEHADDLRQRICAKLAWLGVASGEPIPLESEYPRELRFSVATSRVDCLVVPAREELVLAREAERITGPTST